MTNKFSFLHFCFLLYYQELFPVNKRSLEAFETYFGDADLQLVVDFQVSFRFITAKQRCIWRLLNIFDKNVFLENYFRKKTS